MTNNRAKALEAFDYAIERITEASEGNGGLVNDAALNAYFMLKDHGKKIRAALSEPKWKSMDSAPRDNVYKLGFGIVDTETGNWTMEMIVWDGDKCEWRGWPKYSGQPTHWMHLPDAPTGGES